FHAPERAIPDYLSRKIRCRKKAGKKPFCRAPVSAFQNTCVCQLKHKCLSAQTPVFDKRAAIA
ncbi:hypothetical protein, partial [Bacteroides heparinolyticus]|uniref:hypothetical protein n=1 Tax=Prevotella heparinolytica TaxID=28113 RepID=UPI0035A0D7C6